jgi:hypothetical protein
VWYATNIEICRYVKAIHELVVSADGNGDGIGDLQGIIDHLEYLALSALSLAERGRRI